MHTRVQGPSPPRPLRPLQSSGNGLAPSCPPSALQQRPREAHGRKGREAACARDPDSTARPQEGVRGQLPTHLQVHRERPRARGPPRVSRSAGGLWPIFTFCPTRARSEDYNREKARARV